MNLRISATTLEAFRRWQDSDDPPYVFIDALYKRIEPTEAMRAGTAFHKILENAENVTLDRVEMNGFIFDFSDMEGEIVLPKIREFKFTKQAIIDGVNITYVGVVDAMDGLTVYDHKLTFRTKPEDYEDSMQWRCYLSWLGLKKFTYNLFQKGYTTANEPQNLIKVKDLSQITFCSYPEMDAEILELTSKLIQLIKEYAPSFIEE